MDTDVPAPAVVESDVDKPVPATDPVIEPAPTADFSAIHPPVADAPPLPTPASVPGLPSVVEDALMDVSPTTVAPESVNGEAMVPPGDGEERQLNVTDALSYLDAVKVQFADRPDVYNHFLDIMKDFKGQLIDTPGVIERVSQLFTGHPALIQGFNTFLPVGYRIECTTTARDNALITVTTPTGTRTQTSTIVAPTAMSMNGLMAMAMEKEENNWQAQASGSSRARGTDMMSAALEPNADAQRAAAQAQAAYNIEPALEFVQMLKRRYSPEVYHQFLDLLQSGTRDQNEVFARVESMLVGEPDLLAKFRNIMMDNGSFSLDGPARAPSPPAPRRGRDRADRDRERDREKEREEPPLKRKRKAAEKEKEKEKEKESKAAAKSSRRGAATEASTSKKSKPSALSSNTVDYAAQSYPSAPGSSTNSATDPTRFFERVKKAIDNRDSYHEFLRLCALFTQDALDRARLVREARTYLSQRPELMTQLEELLGWDAERDRMDPAEIRWAQNGGVLQKRGWVELNVRYGSYRRLPEHERNVLCSGRDEMCKSVLNDEWVSHPSFASEDAGFAPARKSPFEEALHRTEEERHEYDFHLDALARTIAALEPVNQRIAHLPPTERAQARLKVPLGGPGKALHARVIKKVYGRGPGQEVLKALHDTPALAVPVVLSRLRQKEDEWKRARAAWSRVWKEIDARAYPRSLDRRAADVRAADKKACAPRALIAQIEAARAEQRSRRASLADATMARGAPYKGWHLSFAMPDTGVIQDVLKLCFGLLDRTPSVQITERKKVEAFLRAFVPTFLALDAPSFNAVFGAVRALVEVQDEGAEAGPSTGGNGRGKRGGGDLRKKTLNREAGKSARKGRTAGAGTPPPAARGSPARNGSSALDPRSILANANGSAGSVEAPAAARPPRRYVFFANSHFYVLLRLLEIAYARIALIKETATELGASTTSSSTASTTSVQDHAQTSSARDEPPADPSSAASSSTKGESLNAPGKTVAQLYGGFLSTCERLFDNEIEPLAFEDLMREMFGNKVAYHVFTLDKLLGAIIKQVQTLLADAQTPKLLELLKRERDALLPGRDDRARYMWDVRNALPEENVFRIDWDAANKVMSMQLLGKDEDDEADEGAMFERWQAYVDAFVSTEAQTPIHSPLSPPFLRRSLKGADAVSADVLARGGLAMKVCVRTYRLFFVSGSEDVLMREPSVEEIVAAERGAKVATEKRARWMEKMNKGEGPFNVVAETPKGEPTVAV